VGAPFEIGQGRPQDLATPDGSVNSVPRSIAADSDDGVHETVLGHAGHHMGVVMLNADSLPVPTCDTLCGQGRGVQIMGDD
jgi:hypothetical protein